MTPNNRTDDSNKKIEELKQEKPKQDITVEFTKKIEKLRQDLETLDMWLTIAAENGLFYDSCTKPSKDCNQGDQQQSTKEQQSQSPKECEPVKNFEDAQKRLKEVFKKLYSKLDNIDIGYCETSLSHVNKFYHDKISSKPLSWRLRIVYAIHIWLVLITLGVLATIFTFHNSLNIVALLNFDKNIVIYAYIGFMAGVIKGLYNIAHATRFRVYRKNTDVLYYVGPFIAAAFAVIIALATLVGLVQPTQQQESSSTQQQESSSTQQPNGIYIVAFTAGLFWQESIRKLSNIFGVKERYSEKDGKIVPEIE